SARGSRRGYRRALRRWTLARRVFCLSHNAARDPKRRSDCVAAGKERVGKRRALIGRDSPLRFAARFSSRRLPSASLPELLQIRLIAAKNVALRLLNIGNTDRVNGARPSAFAVATMLPERPVAPRRRW